MQLKSGNHVPADHLLDYLSLLKYSNELHLQQGLQFKSPDLIPEEEISEIERLLAESQQMLEEGRDIDQAFFNLNHVLKFDYRNSLVWSLLGTVYQNKAEASPDEADFNYEKAVFCQSKASKFESLMPMECRQLLKLIPKYIN